MNDLVVARRYRLGRRIGTGGMGRVWLAMDEVLRREVAVKEVLLPDGLTEQDAAELRQRTLREARTAGTVSHPNVIKVYDVIYAENRPWIVMEYVESRSLAQVIREDGPMSPEEAARMGLAILSALVAAHHAGVLHRDVKPGNVLLGDRRVVLTDFGLATFDDIGSALTASGVVHGSPQFIAPERALDGTSTVAADMWSLGATLYAAVEGRAPYARASSYATLTALATAPPDPPRHAGALKPVLHGLLRRNPASRMKADEVRAWLRQIADGDGDAAKSRIPRQRRQDDPEPNGNSGSSSTGLRSPSTRTEARAPVSHARRNRRPVAGNPSARMRPQATDPATPTSAPPRAADLPVAGSAPPAVGPTPPPSPSAVASRQAAFMHPEVELEHDTDHQMDLAWQLDAAAGVLGSRDDADAARAAEDERRARRRVRTRRLRWLAAVVCVMAAAGGGAIAIRHVRAQDSRTTLIPVTALGTPPANSAITWPCPTKPKQQLPTVPDSRAPYLKYDAPNGWRFFPVGGEGFMPMVPVGWEYALNGTIACFYATSGGDVVGYESFQPKAGSVTDELQAVVNTFVSARVWSNYHGDPLKSALPNTAEWDFSYIEDIGGAPTSMNAVVYVFNAAATRAYAFFYTSRAFGWSNPNGIITLLQTSLVSAPVS